MVRLRLLSRFSGGPPPGGQQPRGTGLRRLRHRHARGASPGKCARLTPLLGFVAAISVCALAVCAFFVPGFAFGATDGSSLPPDANQAAATGPAGGPGSAAATNLAATPSAGSLLVTLPWGSDEGEVGLIQPTEGLTRGPEALAVAPDGRIAVLDSVNRRLLFLDAGGRPFASAPVPLTEPRFLALDDERLYVLDCDADRRLVTLDWNGAVLGAASMPELTDVVTGLFATAEGPCVEVAHASVFVVAGAGIGPDTHTMLDPDVPTALAPPTPARASLHALAGRPLDSGLGRVAKVTFQPGNGVRIASFKVEGGSLTATPTADLSLVLGAGRALEHLVSVDGDGKGGLIVGARLLDAVQQNGRQASLLLTRLILTDSAIGDDRRPGQQTDAPLTLFLADSPFAYLGQPYVVAPDGRVFQPVGTEAGYSIFVHTFAQEVQP